MSGFNPLENGYHMVIFILMHIPLIYYFEVEPLYSILENMVFLNINKVVLIIFISFVFVMVGCSIILSSLYETVKEDNKISNEYKKTKLPKQDMREMYDCNLVQKFKTQNGKEFMIKEENGKDVIYVKGR